MVDDPVYHGARHLVIAEHRAPPAELQVRRDQHRLALVGVGEDLEHQPRALGVERRESEFVDDEKPRPAYLRGLPVQPSLLPFAPQPRDERGRREEPRLDPPLACERAERRGHVGLPGPDIAHQDQWIGNTYLDDSGRDSPASLNSTGDMWPSVEWILKSSYRCAWSESLARSSRVVPNVSRWTSSALGIPSVDSSTALSWGGAALGRRRPLYAEGLEHQVDLGVVKLAAAVRVEYLDVRDREGGRRERRLDRPGVLPGPGGVADDLPVAGVDEQADVVPRGPDCARRSGRCIYGCAAPCRRGRARRRSARRPR